MNITRMRQLLTGAALVALVVSSNGRSQDTEPTECGTPKMHACHCPRLVGDVQGRMTEECHRNSEKRERYIACLRKIPEACDIVEQAYRWMTPEEQERNMGNQCSTRCKKDACRCNDDVCGR